MRIVIKNPAPLGNRLQNWGDYHFGTSLADALCREQPDAEVRQDYWPEWEQKDEGDVLIVLRGKRRYMPSGHVPAFLWVISHPAGVTPIEIENYSYVLAGSEGFQEFVQKVSRVPVTVARQCTDTRIFTPPEADIESQIEARDGYLFIANSRGIKRDIVRWSLEAGTPPHLIGGQWGVLGLSHLVQRESVKNHELPELYRNSRFGLNDHWADMRHFGIINNRILDCLACGLPVITDHFHELEGQFGNVLLFADGPENYLSACHNGEARYPLLLERINALQDIIEKEYSFNTRARQILELFDQYGRAGAGALNNSISAINANHPSSLFEQVVDRYLSATPKSTYRVLHLFPNLQLNSIFEENDERINYFSGGFGTGPWQISLSTNLPQIEGMSFDVVLIDSFESLDYIQPMLRYGFLCGISRVLSASGVLILQGHRLMGDWRDRLIHSGFVEVLEIENWRLYRPRVAIQAESCLVEPYARTLEFKLTAVYKSSTWKIMEPIRKLSALIKRKKKSAKPLPERPTALKGKDPLERWRTK